MTSLKIPNRAIRLKLYKSSILAGINWGHEAMGLAPQVRRRIRATMARQMGCHRTGSVDIVFSMQPRHRDPDFGAFADQVRLYRRFYGNWPESLAKDLAKAWQVQRAKLTEVKYPWQHAKGPVGALQCYLLERGWNIDKPDEWTKPSPNGEPEFKLSMHADWFYLKQELERAHKWEIVMKLNQRQMFQELQQPLDWLPWRRLSRQLTKSQNVALQTWHQGSIFTKCADQEESTQLMCPHCHQAATMIHLLWLCPETQKAFAPLDIEDKNEIEQGMNLEFWAQGLMQLPRYELSTGGAAIQSWGSWTIHDEVKLVGHEVVTIGIGVTSADPRLKYFVVAIVHHTAFNGQLFRKGAVTTVLPGHQSLERAWFYGLRMIAHYVDLQMQVKVQVLSIRAWEAWVNGKHHERFYDLNSLVTPAQRSRIRPLSLTRKQVNDMPPGPFTVQARMRDANKVAKEIALSLRPEELEAEMKVADKRYAKIAHLAIKRIRHLMESPDHFLHQARQKGRETRRLAQERKSKLFLDIGNQSGPQQHQWQERPRGLQCLKCQKRITKHLKYDALQQIHDENCQAAVEVVVKGGDNKQSKATLIQHMIAGELPGMADHTFVLQTHCVVCTSCNGRTLRNSAQDKLTTLALSTCWNQVWEPQADWQGHPSHSLWRKGGKVVCLECQSHAIPHHEGFAASKALKKRCGGHQAEQRTLPTLFNSQKG